MSAPTPSAVLAQYSAALRRAAPQEWEDFVRCFDAFANDVTVAVTYAEQGEILNRQGRAVAFRYLAALYKTCHLPQQNQTNGGI